jgi:uncharacterized protein
VLRDEDGALAIRLARRALADALGGAPRTAWGARSGGVHLPEVFHEPRGVFVTLKRHPSGDLRGCIGYPLPVFPLGEAIPRAALAAAVDDPRFPPVRASELDQVTIEVSVLTVPEPIRAARPDDLVRAVEVGRHGLIVEGLGSSGLLLPQVAPEQGWSSEELLDGTCEKAGLPPRSWRDLRVTVKRFEAEIFAERSPNGPVEREIPPVTRAGGRSAR